MGYHKINNLKYADDTTLIATSVDLTNIQRGETVSLEIGLKLNRQKTKLMIIDRQNNNDKRTGSEMFSEILRRKRWIGKIGASLSEERYLQRIMKPHYEVRRIRRKNTKEPRGKQKTHR